MPIHYIKQDHIVTITIDRYERRNAFDIDLSVQMIDAWERFNDDPEAWVAIVTGVKDVFCAGGDLNTMAQIAKELAETGEGTPHYTARGWLCCYYRLRRDHLSRRQGDWRVEWQVGSGKRFGGADMTVGSGISDASASAKDGWRVYARCRL